MSEAAAGTHELVAEILERVRELAGQDAERRALRAELARVRELLERQELSQGATPRQRHDTSVVTIAGGAPLPSSRGMQRGLSFEFQNPQSSAISDGWMAARSEGQRRLCHSGTTGLDLRPSFQETVCEEVTQTMLESSGVRPAFSMTFDTHGRDSGSSRCLLHPNSIARITFDSASALVLAWELFSTPLIVAWNLNLEGFLERMAIVTIAFWIVDLVLNFRTSYYYKGDLVLDGNAIARRYLRGFFAIDLLLILMDAAGLVLRCPAASCHSGAEAARSSRFVRFAKIGRLLRIVAVVRIVRVAPAIEEMIDKSTFGDGFRVICFIIFLLMGFVYMTHVVSCAWFSLGENRSGGWTADIVPPTLANQYWASFHWSISQLVGGSVEIVPQNLDERAYTVVCMLLGVVGSCSFISLVSAAIVRLQEIQEVQEVNRRLLRRFLRQNAIDPRLSASLQRHIAERVRQKRLLNISDVPSLVGISPVLWQELHYYTFSAEVKTFGIFRLWERLSNQLLRRICSEAVRFQFASPDDALIMPAMEAAQAMHLHSGRAVYSEEDSKEAQLQEEGLVLEAGHWFCEVALWCKWRHVGKMAATDYSKILSLKAATMVTVLEDYPAAKAITVAYAQIVFMRLKAVRSFCEVDFATPGEDFGEIVQEMAPDMSLAIGRAVLAEAAVKCRELLEKEMESGKCIVVESGDGPVERRVHISTMQLAREDGLLLVCLGRWHDGEPQPDGKLPGIKHKRGEQPSQALERFLRTDLAALQMDINVQDTELTSHVEWSRRFGIKSRYVKAIHRGQFLGTVPRLASQSPLRRDPLQPQRVARRRASQVRGPVNLEERSLPQDAFAVSDDADNVKFYAWASLAEIAKYTDAELRDWLTRLQALQEDLLLAHRTPRASGPGLQASGSAPLTESRLILSLPVSAAEGDERERRPGDESEVSILV